jgi:hypothetical protein
VRQFAVVKVQTESILSPTQEIDFSEITLLSTVGTGAEATVYKKVTLEILLTFTRATWRNMNVAVKTFLKMFDLQTMSETELTRVKQEVCMLTYVAVSISFHTLRELDHPNVVKFFGN